MRPASRLSFRSFARGLGLLVLYLGLTVWRTWPLAAHLRTCLPNTAVGASFDGLYPIWTLAWETHALTTAPLRLADANIFHPAPRALFYGPAAFGALPFFAPVFLLTGNPFLAINVTFLVCVALTALGLHLVVRRWTGSELGGFLAAWTVLTSAWLFTWVPSVPHYAVLPYIPWIALLAARSGSTRKIVPLVTLQCLTDVVYVAPAIVGPLGVLALGRLARRRSRAAGLGLLGALVLSLLLLLPVYFGYWRARADNPHGEQQTLWAAPLLAVILAPPLRLGWNGLAMQHPAFEGSSPMDATPVTLGLIVAGAACLAVGRTRGRESADAWVPGVLWTTVGILMSTSKVAIFDGPPVWLPHFAAAVLYSPWLFSAIRVPERFGVAALMGFAMLTGVALAQCVREAHLRIRWPLVGVLLGALSAGLMYVEQRPHLAVPFPIATAAFRPSLLDALRKTQGPLLELPVGVPGPHDTVADKFAIASAHARAMCRSIFHWRPLLNGYSSYWPTGFIDRMELSLRLPDAEALAALRQASGVRSILVRIQELPPAQRRAWFRVAESGGRNDLRLVAQDNAELLFDVLP
jgi:hypothetical protein